MRHGEKRNHRIEPYPDQTLAFVVRGGVEVKGSYSGGDRSVCERWCEGCQQWIVVDGITGPQGAIRWLGTHEDHTVRKVESS